jgi:hypothetical protein
VLAAHGAPVDQYAEQLALLCSVWGEMHASLPVEETSPEVERILIPNDSCGEPVSPD